MSDRKYYEAYDDRYRQVHAENLQWAPDDPSAIVSKAIDRFSIQPGQPMLEIGCGEGRDARPLLQQGFNLLATDISQEAVSYCQKLDPEHVFSYRVLDCILGQMEERFDFIYAVAVLHMLVEDADRAAFYRFIRNHLNPNGVAVICTMGDGSFERSSDISTAFELQERIHQESGKTLMLVGTSCRVVSFPTFEAEIAHGGLEIIEEGITSIENHFSEIMYAIVKRSQSNVQRI